MATVSLAAPEDAMKTIDNPEGGQITYGTMQPQASVQAAMGAMLRQIHARYGDRPQVGRFFQDRSGQALAAFFNVTAQASGGQHISGLVIVSLPPGGPPSAAVLTDTAQRFPQTVNSMLQRLSAEWNASHGPTAAPAGPAPVGGAEPLHQVNFPDGSGSIGLPSGWQLASAQMGAMEARGPNGEDLIFGVYIPVMDPNYPQTRYMMNMETQGGRLPLPGLWVAIPYTTDVGMVLNSMAAQLAQKQKRPAPTINITKITDGPAQRPLIAKIIQADSDAHDGKGLMALSIQLQIIPPMDGTGNWGISVYQAAVPKPLFERETPTLVAIAKSYKVNTQVVQNEVNQQIQLSNAYTQSVLERARSSQAAFDQKLAHDRANEDIRDRSFQAFDNVILGQSVVRDTERNAHGTLSNDYADALVKAHPERFEYVPTQDYVKGIDY
jgi:hypothetical protein